MDKNEILKAIIKQNPEEDISEYERILNEMEGNFSYPDIFFETVSKIFDLAIEGKLDPWKIDIIEFKDLFFSEKSQNFEIAGLLISTAWHILFEKSNAMLNRKMEILHEGNEDNFENYPEFENIIEDDITNMPDLREPIMHKERKNITLVELLDSIKIVYKQNKKNTEKVDVPLDINRDILMKSNKEDIEAGIKRSIDEIKKYINPFFLEDYWGETNEERAEFLLYMLFLQKRGKVNLEQYEHYGNVSITKLF